MQNYHYHGNHDSNSDDDPPAIRDIKKSFPMIRPGSISGLWEDDAITHSSLIHGLSQHLHLWASKEEILNLLNDTSQLNYIYSTICRCGIELGLQEKEYSPDHDRIPSNHIRVASCGGCNQPCDNGGTSCASHVFVKECFQNDSLHKMMLVMTVVCQLLAYPEADAFVLILTTPFDVIAAVDAIASFLTKPFDLTVERMSPNFDTGLTTALVGVFDNCANYPKLNHVTAALLSLICARRPSATLGDLSENLVVPSVLKYLRSTMNLVQNNDCVVDEYFGVCAFLNIVPLLYHFGSWEVSHHDSSFSDVAAGICMVGTNICHWITPPNGEDTSDSRPSLVKLPETDGARIFIERMITDEDDEDSTQGKWRKELLELYPKAFAVIAALEILQWYSFNGVDLRIPILVSCERTIDIAGAVEDYEANFKHLIERHPGLDYIEPVVTALIQRKKMPRPSQARSLLHGPLSNARRRCGLPSCRKREVFLRCSGCNRLEFYCCKVPKADY
jgi:hypothetical protein